MFGPPVPDLQFSMPMSIPAHVAGNPHLAEVEELYSHATPLTAGWVGGALLSTILDGLQPSPLLPILTIVAPNKSEP
jgi:hypothetical protein